MDSVPPAIHLHSPEFFLCQRLNLLFPARTLSPQNITGTFQSSSSTPYSCSNPCKIPVQHSHNNSQPPTSFLSSHMQQGMFLTGTRLLSMPESISSGFQPFLFSHINAPSSLQIACPPCLMSHPPNTPEYPPAGRTGPCRWPPAW